jgi:2-polyprenyl-3-methyl-5-hydroxy-6-metoxy-1,4-benzoquinol methylase
MKLDLPPAEKLILTSSDDVAEGRYYSGNPIVRRVYRNRLQYAIDMISGRPKRLLEIGYGSGALTPTLLKMADEVVSIDIHDKLAEVSKNIPGNFMKESIFDMPFTEKFDCIVCLSVVEHLDGFEKAFEEVKRHLTDDGYVIWGVPSDNFVVTFWFWLKKSPALVNHVNSKKDLLSAISRHFKVVQKKTLRLVVPDYYTVIKARLK